VSFVGSGGFYLHARPYSHFLDLAAASSVDKNRALAMLASTKSRRLHMPPSDTEGNKCNFYMMVRKENVSDALVDSSWYSFGGFLWRLFVLPNGKMEKKGCEFFLECGGPDLQASNSSKRYPRKWSCSVRVLFRLLHPSKWSGLGIYAADTSRRDHMLPPDVNIPNVPRDHVTCHSTRYGPSETYGRMSFARFAMLQPGLFSDDDFNFVVVCHFYTNDFLCRYNGNQEIQEDDEDPTGTTAEINFEQALAERAALVDKLFECEEKLGDTETTSVRNMLEKEIQNIAQILEVLPDLQTFL